MTEPDDPTDHADSAGMTNGHVSALTAAVDLATLTVDRVAADVVLLNERVYTRNALDQARNVLLSVAVLTFVVFSVGLIAFLIRFNSLATDNHDGLVGVRALVRHDADCSQPPGRLPDGSYNKGECFLRQGEFVRGAIDAVADKVDSNARALADQLHQAEANAIIVRGEVARLRAQGTRAGSDAAAVLERVLRPAATPTTAPTTSTTTATVPAPRASPPTTAPVGLLCALLRIGCPPG